MYPEKDNATYKDDPTRVNRRQFTEQSKYDALVRVNGPLHVKLVNERRQCEES